MLKTPLLIIILVLQCVTIYFLFKSNPKAAKDIEKGINAGKEKIENQVLTDKNNNNEQENITDNMNENKGTNDGLNNSPQNLDEKASGQQEIAQDDQNNSALVENNPNPKINN